LTLSLFFLLLLLLLLFVLLLLDFNTPPLSPLALGGSRER
jgi:hypothetical protein